MALGNFVVLGLLLGQGKAMQGLYLQFLLNGVNVVMTCWLGLVMGWGVAGIAWGTVLGESVALVVGLTMVYWQFRAVPNPSLARILDMPAIRRMFAVNRDIMLRSFFLLISRTNHLKGLKIGIMGCIVNGPGEMADADYGYVGAGPDKVTLYRGQEVVKKNVSSAQALDELIKIIQDDGLWIDEVQE